MKKLMIVVSLLLCMTVCADWLVYDYRASVKRFEPVFKSSDGECVYYLKQVSDTIQGYIVLNDCDINDSPCAESFKGYLYAFRRNDKLYSKAVWKTEVELKPSFYGINFIPCKLYSDKAEKIRETRRATKCGVVIDFDFFKPISDDELVSVKGSECEFPYGFFGWFNKETSVSNTGFGTTDFKVYDPKVGICTSDEGDICMRVKSASGSFVSSGIYKGTCGGITVNSCNQGVVDIAPVSGVWTLKLNVLKTKGAPTSDNAIEAYVLWLLDAGHCFDASVPED